MNGSSLITAAASLLTVALALTGCRSFPWRDASDNRVVAAREERLGLESLHSGNLAEAEARFRNALRNCPFDANVRHDLANVLWQRGAHDEAVEEMGQAIRGAGGDPAWLTELGFMFLADGKTDEAFEAAEKALAANPELPCVWRLRGDVMKQRKDYEVAKSNYYRALNANADPSLVLLELADIYRLQDRPRRALATLQRLNDTVTTADRPAQLPYLQAIALQSLGRHEDAIPLFEETLRTDGAQPDLLMHLAESQLAIGRGSAARESAVAAARNNPLDPRIQQILTATEPGKARLASGP